MALVPKSRVLGLLFWVLWKSRFVWSLPQKHTIPQYVSYSQY